jgi:hypothetical protein
MGIHDGAADGRSMANAYSVHRMSFAGSTPFDAIAASVVAHDQTSIAMTTTMPVKTP